MTCSYNARLRTSLRALFRRQQRLHNMMHLFHFLWSTPSLPIDHCDFSLPFRQSLRASSQSLQSPPHLSITNPQLLARTMFSTPLSCRIIAANRSVLGSLGKNLAEYGSSLSSTTLSLSLSLSTCLDTDSGSSGSGLVATDAQ